MIGIPFFKRLLIFFGAEMYLIGRKKSDKYVLSFAYEPGRLGTKYKLLMVVREKWNLKFLITGRSERFSIPSS